MDTRAMIAAISIMILPLIFAITLHEAAHGFVASKLGDQTAQRLGRVTLNPLKHIDPIGTVLLPIFMMIVTRFTFMFGWAKPVPVDFRNLRNPRRDMALVAIAGPSSNLLMAVMWAAVAKGAWMLKDYVPFFATNLSPFFLQAGLYGILINSVLMILNLIPIPPLDGSRVAAALLPPHTAYQYNKLEPYGIWIILGFLFFFGNYILLPPVHATTMFLIHLFRIPVSL